jgi:hypothetical protein
MPAPPTKGQSRLNRYLSQFLLVWIVVLGYFVWQYMSPRPEAEAPQADEAPASTKAAPRRGFDAKRDQHESAEARKLVDRMLIKELPGANLLIAYVDISNKDGHLIVALKPVYRQLGETDRAPLENGIVEFWAKTEYVADREWNPDVEFIEQGTAQAQARSHIRHP